MSTPTHQGPGAFGDDAGAAVITIAHGRHEHLRRQIDGLLASDVAPARHVVVAMDDDDLANGLVDLPSTPWPLVLSTCHRGAGDTGLPLSQARNIGAQDGAGCSTLIFLDVDCIPAPELVGTYLQRVQQRGRPAPALWCGTVAYLPEPLPAHVDLASLASRAAPHPARPVPEPGTVLPEDRFELFWSLSFALSTCDFAAIGGFCQDYSGYGAEDTDFAQMVRDLGGSLTWTGDAAAYHQYHPTSSPPVQHVASIVANATVFHRRWGWWPMGGWFEAFAQRGLVRWIDEAWVLA